MTKLISIPAKFKDRHREIDLRTPEEAERQGFGKARIQEIRNALGAEQNYNYWAGTPTAMKKPKANDVHDLAFDPLTLGLSTDLSSSETVKDYLSFPEPKSMEIIGNERIGDAETLHVKISTRIDTVVHFWIEASHPTFRVHRKTWELNDGSLSSIVDSTFDPSDNSAVLPKSVRIQRFGKERKPNRVTTITVESLEFGPQFPEPGSLASLNLPVGTAVVDDQTGQTVGFWNGSSLDKVLSKSVKAAMADPDGSIAEPGKRVWVPIVGGIAGLLLFVVAMVWLIRSRPRAA